MKVIAIGDLHGRDNWKSVDFAGYDKIIFLGDYVDSKDGHALDDISKNLIEIIELKLKHPTKFELLLGNHDIQYLHYPKYRCSGFLKEAKNIWAALFRNHESIFRVAWQYENYLFTHAGISKSWLQRHRKMWNFGLNFATNCENLYASSKNQHILCEASIKRGGKNPYGGIFWADKSETCIDYLDNIHQIVGHTRIHDIVRYGDHTASITYVDCLGFTHKFWEADI